MHGLVTGKRFMVGRNSQLLHFGDDGRIRTEDGIPVRDELQEAIIKCRHIIRPVEEKTGRGTGRMTADREYTRTVIGVEVTLINPPNCEKMSYREVIGMARIWAEYAKNRHGQSVKKILIEWDEKGAIIQQLHKMDGEEDWR